MAKVRESEIEGIYYTDLLPKGIVMFMEKEAFKNLNKQIIFFGTGEEEEEKKTTA